jgi:hypothetical protein
MDVGEARFRVEERELSTGGDAYEMEIVTSYDVIEVATGRIVMSFRGTWSTSLGDDGTWEPSGRISGAARVAISEDGRRVRVWRAEAEAFDEYDLPDAGSSGP